MPSSTPENCLTSSLDAGVIEPSCCVKCPPCGGLYVLTNADGLGLFETAFCSSLTNCCINYAFDSTSYETFVETLNEWGVSPLPYDEIIDGTYYKYAACNNGFKDQVEFLKSEDPSNFSTIISNGILEIGSPGEYVTGINTLMNFYTNNCQLSPLSIGEFINMIVDKGVVFYCDRENFIRASRQIFQTYIEIMNIDSLYPPCGV